MFRLAVKFLRLPLKKKWFLLCIFILLGMVRLCILVVPFRFISLLLKKPMPIKSNQVMDTSSYLELTRWSLACISPYTPWESKCLVQAITAKLLLRLKGVPSILCLGVARDEHNKLMAHAWLCSGKTIVTGGEGYPRFTVVSKYTDELPV
ncbi:MAG: hypothetical protein H6Q75_1074 [Firmicutes bacterium]|nr:hypothetical protein [Bacillota bacterium]